MFCSDGGPYSYYVPGHSSAVPFHAAENIEEDGKPTLDLRLQEGYVLCGVFLGNEIKIRVLACLIPFLCR